MRASVVYFSFLIFVVDFFSLKFTFEILCSQQCFSNFISSNLGLQIFSTLFGIFSFAKKIDSKFCMYKFVLILCLIILYIKFVGCSQLLVSDQGWNSSLF